MKKIKVFIKEHYLKIISLIFALSLWFVAMNIQNEVTTKDFVVPLTLENLDILRDNNFILANQEELEKKNVTIFVRDTTINLEKLKELEKNGTKIKAIIDFKPIDYSQTTDLLNEEKTAAISYKMPDGFRTGQFIYMSDVSVPVILDKFERKTVNITIDTIGEVAEGYKNMTGITNPEIVVVSGAKSILDKIDSVKVSVNISGATNKINIDKEPIVYDRNGNDITRSVSIEGIKTINIEVPIYKTARFELPAPKYTGEIAEGYVIIDVTPEPKFVELYGESDEIDKFAGIDIEPFVLNGESETFTRIVDLRKYLMDTKLTLSKVSDYEMTVTFILEKEVEREFIIPIGQLEFINGEYAVDILTNELNITLLGQESLIDNIDAKTIKGKLDFSELEPGIHELNVSLSIPEWAKEISEAPIITVEIYDEDLEIENPLTENINTENPLPENNNTENSNNN